MKQTGYADLPLHTGIVPRWLADRMMQMGTLIIESLEYNFGREEVLVRLSDPLWFQSLGAVMGMDWHSSGITTSVMYALKRGINPRAKELGICICGGRGKYSRRTPDELQFLAGAAHLDGDALVKTSRLVAKVDGAAVQDGFQLYQHNFILASSGEWAVVQQGMNPQAKTARRYHWCSSNLRSFVEEPHTAVVGENRGVILNLTDRGARGARSAILDIARGDPERTMRTVQEITRSCKEAEKDAPEGTEQGELFGSEESHSYAPAAGASYGTHMSAGLYNSGRSMTMPAHHDVRAEDVDLKRLGGVLAAAYTADVQDFESLLLTPGLGPRTLQSLALVSEVIYGTPSRFTDPARFSFAHGGKDGHPFPVPCRVYDESIRVLRESIQKSKLGISDKEDCLRRLYGTALGIEQNCDPRADFDAVLRREREHSDEWGGRTCFDGK